MRDNSAASAEAWDRIALRDAIADVFRAHGSLVLPRHEAEFLVEVVIKRAPDAPHFLDDHEPLYAQLRSAGAHAEFARLALDSMTADAAIRFVVTCCRAEASAPDSLFTPRRATLFARLDRAAPQPTMTMSAPPRVGSVERAAERALIDITRMLQKRLQATSGSVRLSLQDLDRLQQSANRLVAAQPAATEVGRIVRRWRLDHETADPTASGVVGAVQRFLSRHGLARDILLPRDIIEVTLTYLADVSRHERTPQPAPAPTSPRTAPAPSGTQERDTPHAGVGAPLLVGNQFERPAEVLRHGTVAPPEAQAWFAARVERATDPLRVPARPPNDMPGRGLLQAYGSHETDKAARTDQAASPKAPGISDRGR